MQNKGVLKLFTTLLTLVCLYQLTFTWKSRSVEAEAKEYSMGNAQVELNYLDSMNNEIVLDLGFKQFTLKEVRDYELNLGLDLKGGINVVLEISQKDILTSLANFSENIVFQKALIATEKEQNNSQKDFVTLFFQNFDKINLEEGNKAKLADYDIFGGGLLKKKINAQTNNQEVQALIQEEANNAVTLAYNVLRARIDKFGVAQPNIQQLENSGRILVELPGIKDAERVKKLLQSTAKLEFWETHTFGEVFTFFQNINTRLKEKQTALSSAKKEAKKKPTTKKTTEKTDTDIDGLLNQIDENEDPAESVEAQTVEPFFSLIAGGPLDNASPIVGYVSESDKEKVLALIYDNKDLLPANLRFAKFLWTSKPIGQSNVYELLAVKSNRKGKAPIDGGAIVNARRDFDQNSKPVVSMSMDRQGAKEWAKLTRNNIGKSIAIVLDQSVYSFPNVNQEITGGNSQISGNFTIEEAEDLANVLNAGKLPAPAKIIQAEVVGPSLGQASISSGMTSFIIAFFIILLWLLFYYSKAGVYSVIALVANILFIFGTLASFGATLTLPGIAGIVLTIGMAVDANVLIYERIKEELFKGKSLIQAVTDGYNNAYSSIIDANITTLLTAIVLFLFGTGPVKGFATTLLIGIFTSLFSAIFITRLFISAKLKRQKSGLAFYTALNKNWFSKTNFQFIAKRKIGYVISSLIILAGIVSLSTRGLNKGVEFVGGRSYIINYAQPVKTQEIAKALTTKFIDEKGNKSTPEVKTFGSSSQVKITTKYKVNEISTDVDTEIQTKIFEATKQLLPKGISLEQFQNGQGEFGLQQSLKVGPSIADDITRGAFISVFISLAIVFLYIFVRFKKWQYSLGAVVAVFHDSLIILSVFSLLYSVLPFSLEIDQSFIAALLTIIGYSLNDTVVVFDRVREYVRKFGNKKPLAETINEAANSTLSRTINTSLTTLFVILVMFIFGAESIQGFLFALLVGILVGTYSSIFIASATVVDSTKNIAVKK